ncbi:hypothetical protein M5K25_026570 [Dendrobium thyrsiflorum]|uniref:Uncharacterized protein n=1 Tax=Dendrobium thyrsiflorum TaxID=117978 RepID=A0ABD0TXU5_DENTH
MEFLSSFGSRNALFESCRRCLGSNRRRTHRLSCSSLQQVAECPKEKNQKAEFLLQLVRTRKSESMPEATGGGVLGRRQLLENQSVLSSDCSYNVGSW